jgi:hypothetical protein
MNRRLVACHVPEMDEEYPPLPAVPADERREVAGHQHGWLPPARHLRPSRALRSTAPVSPLRACQASTSPPSIPAAYAPARRSAPPAPTYRVMSCLSEPEVLEPSAHDAGAERTGSTGDHSSCNSWAMLRTKFFGRPENGAGGCTEPFAESSMISRSVIGTFGEPSGNRNWCCDNDTGICPELIRILHFLFPPPHVIPGDGLFAPSVMASQSLYGLRRSARSPRRPPHGRLGDVRAAVIAGGPDLVIRLRVAERVRCAASHGRRPRPGSARSGSMKARSGHCPGSGPSCSRRGTVRARQYGLAPPARGPACAGRRW